MSKIVLVVLVVVGSLTSGCASTGSSTGSAVVLEATSHLDMWLEHPVGELVIIGKRAYVHAIVKVNDWGESVDNRRACRSQAAVRLGQYTPTPCDNGEEGCIQPGYAGVDSWRPKVQSPVGEYLHCWGWTFSNLVPKELLVE